MKLTKTCFFLMICVFIHCTCTKSVPQDTEEKTPKPNIFYENPDAKILFIGNSLTYTNNLPQLMQEYAFKKEKKINVFCQCLPNYALIDHWNEGIIQEKIKTEGYTHIIIQQGPSSQEEGRMILMEYGAMIKQLADANKATLGFYMVWPARSNYGNFDGVIKNYTDAARVNQAILCPVGQEWKKYFDETKDFSYYSSDDFHPSLKGSIKAAEVIYHSLF